LRACTDRAARNVHENASTSDGAIQLSLSSHQKQPIPLPPSDELLPPNIAQRFAAEAASTLTKNEIQALLEFLQRTCHFDRRALQHLVQHKLETFHAAESEESKGSCGRLGTPSGPEDADIGLIMHCQTKRGQIGEFWDHESPSIQLLAAKGLNPEFLYGYDWHWRAETSARRPGKVSCPTNTWTATQVTLQDAMSAELLEALPLFVGSSCGVMPKGVLPPDIVNAGSTLVTFTFNNLNPRV
jgi:hypothetical protein